MALGVGSRGFTLALTLAMAVGSLALFSFAALAPFLIDEFGLSRSQLGSLTAAFVMSATVSSLILGRAVDRLKGRILLLGCFTVSVVTTGAMSVATSYAWMLVNTLAAGTVLGAVNPTTNKLVAIHASEQERPLMMGVKQSGVQVAAFLVGALLPTAAAALGWRRAFGLLMLLPMVGFLATVRFVPEPTGRSPQPSRSEAQPPPKNSLRSLTLYAFLIGSGLAAVIAYLPLYAHERIGLAPATAGLATSVTGLTAIGGGILWARVSEHFRHVSTPLTIIAILSLAATVATWRAASGAGWLLWPSVVAYGASAFSWNAVGMLAILKEVGAAQAGRASGLVLFGFFGGFIASPILFGYSVDHTRSYTWGWTGVAVIFALAASIAHSWRRASSKAGGSQRVTPTRST